MRCVTSRKPIHRSSGIATASIAGKPAARAIAPISGCLPTGFSVIGEVRFFDKPADSGNMVSRGFCPTCGSAVYSTNSAMDGLVFPRASSLDDPNVITPGLIVYASRAAAWDHLDPALPVFPEMPEGPPQSAIEGTG